MDVTLEPQKTFWEKFQQKLADSRIFALSLALHVLLVVFAGGIVLFQYATEQSDFVAEGGDGLLAPTDNLAPPPETPQDTVPTETFEAAQPDVNSPNLDVISTTASNNSFKVNTATPKVQIQTNTADLAKATGNVAKGLAVGTGGLPGTMSGRMGAGRSKAMAANKMKPASELAVLRGLEWLRQNQNPDGSWGDGNKGAMTGLGILCFLGHGETPESQQYGLTVSKAIQWTLDQGTKYQGRLHMDDEFNPKRNSDVYEHAILTYALGEYYTMTKDERVTELLKQAVSYIVQGQGPGGGWMYSYDKTANDLSVGGWQIQALKAAHLTQLGIPGVDGALDRAMEAIDRARGKQGGYGYREPGDKYSLTGVGVLCRLFWKGDRGDVSKGMDFILDKTDKELPVKYKSEHADLYAWYYHTQAALMFGGLAWQKWNRWFQDEITNSQSPDGSWPMPGGKGHGPKPESKSGAVYRTTLCILMLEVFYRYMPSNAAI
jgi:hypothetical protein